MNLSFGLISKMIYYGNISKCNYSNRNDYTSAIRSRNTNVQRPQTKPLRQLLIFHRSYDTSKTRKLIIAHCATFPKLNGNISHSRRHRYNPGARPARKQYKKEAEISVDEPTRNNVGLTALNIWRGLRGGFVRSLWVSFCWGVRRQGVVRVGKNNHRGLHANSTPRLPFRTNCHYLKFLGCLRVFETQTMSGGNAKPSSD